MSTWDALTGRGGGGAAAYAQQAGTGGSVTRAPQNDAAARQFVLDNYGAMWASFLNDPELGPILMKAGYDRVDPAILTSRVMNTNWWRSRSDAQRQYEQLANSDPAALERMRQAKRAEIWDLAAQFGVPASAVGPLTENALKFGMSEAQIKDFLSTQVTHDATRGTNLVNTLYDQMHKYAGDYGVKIDDETALDFARKVMAGEMTDQDAVGFFKDRAKEAYWWIGDQLEKGITTKQYFEPVRQTIAQTLELSPDSIDLFDPKYRDVIMRVEDNGNVRGMNLTEAADWARSQEDWKKTKNASDAAYDTVGQLAKMFGQA